MSRREWLEVIGIALTVTTIAMAVIDRVTPATPTPTAVAVTATRAIMPATARAAVLPASTPTSPTGSTATPTATLTRTPAPPTRPLTNTPVKPECVHIGDTFPQSPGAVREHFRLPSAWHNFKLVYEECGAIATGFVFEGNTEFELEVPQGGCIDSFAGAFFSEKPVPNAFGGLRVYGGAVRATGVTYRAAWCNEHP